MRASIEVAEIFRAAGSAYRAARAGHLSLDQLKVMSAIEHCRTAVMRGHVEACTDCGHWRVSYNSCRNRHCPRCQGAVARTWLAEREADLLPVGYFHVVFTLPAEVADIALQNKAAVYGLLFQAASETMTTIAIDPKHLGARIGITAVLHTWGSAMTHHPHIHMVVPGGGLSPDGSRWVSSRPAFLLPVRVLGKLFRRLFLSRLTALHDAGRLGFHGSLAHLANRRTFLRHLAPVRKKRWVVYAKPPFAGPETVLAYLSCYTHRVAISNSRLLRFDQTGVTFRYKDYRRAGGRAAAGHDAQPRRVHPPLPAPRPAEGLPPHPPLWPARRPHPQGPYRTRPQTARGHSAAGCRARRARRYPPAMPVLRRAHGRHRDLRTLVPGSCPAVQRHFNRDHHTMIRHGSIFPRHAVPPLPASVPLAPATSPATSTLTQTVSPTRYPCRRFFPSATPRPRTAHSTGRRTAQPASGKPLSP
ncbi:hypothetical protein GGR49_001247 [Sphingomonas carotinifaciens]|nr:hypothetical protein [Sphingomonas carotinifaciens]